MKQEFDGSVREGSKVMGEVKLLEKKRSTLVTSQILLPICCAVLDLQGLEFTKETDRSFGLFQGSDRIVLKVKGQNPPKPSKGVDLGNKNGSLR